MSVGQLSNGWVELRSSWHLQGSCTYTFHASRNTMLLHYWRRTYKPGWPESL